MKFKRDTYLFLIIIIFLACILTNIHALNKTRVIRRYDEADRISESIIFSEMILDAEYQRVFNYFLEFERNGHPKLVPFLGGITLAFLTQYNLQDIDLMILCTNAVFIFILLFSIYKISFLICNNKTIGLFSVFFLLCSPIVFGHSRILMLDLPAAALVSLCLLALLKTRNFKSLTFSFLTGITLIFAQLTKETSAIFIFPPLIYYFFKSIYIPGNRRQKIGNFVTVVFIFFIFISLIYFKQENRNSLNVYFVNFFSTDTQWSIFYYLKCFPVFYLGLLFSISVTPIVIYFLWKIKKENKFLIYWFLIPLIIFTITSNKSERYMLPILPVFFLLVTLNIFKLSPKLRKAYIIVLIFCSLTQYAILNYFPDLLPYPLNKNGLLCMKNDKENRDFCIAYNTRMFLFKERDFYVREKIISFFESKTELCKDIGLFQKEGNFNILFIFNTGLHCGMRNKFHLKNIPIDVYCPQQAAKCVATLPGEVDWGKYLLTFDYVMYKTGNLGKRGFREDISGEFVKSLEANINLFEEEYSFDVQGGDRIFIYKNIGRIKDF